jgi:hypothetical protein
LLPPGKVDPGLRAPDAGLDLDAVASDARLLEDLGYDGVVIEETKQDPYVVMALAAQATRRLKIGTAITNCGFSIGVKNEADKAKLADTGVRVHADPLDTVWRRLVAGRD